MIVNENEAAELSKAKEDIMKLWIDGVYIGAAYVAAGFVASYQSPEYLKEYFKKDVDTDLPGVRFDIEARIILSRYIPPCQRRLPDLRTV